MINHKMALLWIQAFLTAFVLVECDESSTGLMDSLSSGKRQHSIMRFGKRPSGGLLGKREDPQHRFLFMGKREEPYHFLQGDDNSYKRGHTIMRFGKRGDNLMRFGRREEDEKRGGHNMMYFGKRGGHSMMYFGKRGNDYDAYPEEMYDDDGEKRAHSMIHFGKREDDSKRASHSMIHFGKRFNDDEDQEIDELPLPIFWSPEMTEKRNHNLLRFGKKNEGSRASHAMIHFGKRSLPVANHSEEVVTRTKREQEEEESPLVWDEDDLEYQEAEKRDGPAKNAFLRFG